MLIYLPQAIGFVGLLFAIISFQKNDNKGILFFQLLAALTFSLHFALLGAFTGATMNLLGAARNIVFFNREKNWANKKIWLYLFIMFYIIIGLQTWKNTYSVLPIIAMILSTIGLWIKNAKFTRMIILPSSPCWLIYNFVNSSIAGVFTEVFVLSSLVIAVIRFDILKQQKAID
jgi:hypothetical protein